MDELTKNLEVKSIDEIQDEEITNENKQEQKFRINPRTGRREPVEWTTPTYRSRCFLTKADQCQLTRKAFELRSKDSSYPKHLNSYVLLLRFLAKNYLDKEINNEIKRKKSRL